MTASEFDNHPVFEKLEQTITRLSDPEVRSVIDLEKLNLYDSSCKFIKDRIKHTIPVLVPIGELNTILQEIENGITQINAFIGSKNTGHLNNADANFSSAVSRIRNLPIPFSKSDFNFSKSITNFEETVSSKYKQIEIENNKLQDELKNIKSDLIRKQNEIKQVTDLLVSKTNEINNLTNAFQTEFNNIKATANQNFEADRKTFRAEISEDRKIFEEEITEDRETFGKTIEKLTLSIENRTKDLVFDINTKLIEAKKLVDVIGNIGVTGNYQIIANYHKKAANLWRIVAIVFMSVLSFLLIYTIWDIKGVDYDWTKSMVRVVALAVLSYPATYAAKESSKHRKLETLNRRLELEFASIGPFIEILPEDKKREIKAKLVEKYFCNNNGELEKDERSNDEFSIGGFEKILKAFIPYIKK